MLKTNKVFDKNDSHSTLQDTFQKNLLTYLMECVTLKKLKDLKVMKFYNILGCKLDQWQLRKKFNKN